MARTETYTKTITLQEDTCCVCGVMFAAPKSLLDARREDGKSFFCPNGHGQVYRATLSDELRKQLQAEQERRIYYESQLTNANDQLKASQRELERHKKRAANGVCPCCHRTFAQVQRHMKSQHPEHVAQVNK